MSSVILGLTQGLCCCDSAVCVYLPCRLRRKAEGCLISFVL